MKIYFIRHGETQENIDHIISGQNNAKLTEEAKKQVFDGIPQIPKDFSIIYSSDLIRCKQTAEIINQKFNLPIVYDTRLREIDVGSFQGKYSKDIDQKVRSDIKTIEYDVRPFGGESSEDVKKRILDFVKDIRKEHYDKNILAITSSGIIRLAHYIFNNNNIHEVIHNSSIHEFEFPSN